MVGIVTCGDNLNNEAFPVHTAMDVGIYFPHPSLVGGLTDG